MKLLRRSTSASVKKAAPARKGSVSKKSVVSSLERASRVIFRPYVTEKASRGASAGVYTFLVDPRATRTQISLAVQSIYGIRPKKVRVICSRAEPVHFRRSQGKEAASKKALVALPKGRTIDVYEGV